ncbi:MAG TPA: dihydrodipicolinate synthase family protein, partial [Bryobacteraceae bacterium]|nr:dihydrodipicolinate synthase family protein [Bryobacteraceae bacterium]
MPDLAHRYYAALVLPFDANGKVDEGAYRDMIRYFLQDRFRGVGGLIANPEAGEVYYLTREEKRRVAEIAVREAGGRMPVFGGVFDLTTEGCVECARDAKRAGVDGLFLLPPAGCIDLVGMWNAERYPEYWLDQIQAIDDAAGLPIITHPVANPTPQWGLGIPGEAARLICQRVPHIIGWK